MSDFILPEPADMVDPISESECSSLGNNNGLDISDGENTCEALTSRLLPLIAQIIPEISSGVKTIFANEDSKCDDMDENPTLASILSRIYRLSQAFTCILCQYDPTIANLLTSGTYPQVLMGKPNENAYPMWVTPDSKPTTGSRRPVTSDGVFKAIQDAIMSVWHMWDKGNSGSFAYYLLSTDTKPTTGNVEGDYILVYDPATFNNTIYKWTSGSWVEDEVIEPDDMKDFSVAHIEKGTYADKGIYWFRTGWNILDADIGDLEARISALEAAVASAVGQVDTTTKYQVGVVDTYAEAQAITPTTGVTKIVFIRST